MSLIDLIRLLEARIAALNNARGSASAVGDIQQVYVIDEEINTTQITLDQIKTLTT